MPSNIRSRGDRPDYGTAVARASVTGLSFPLFGPWGRWFPWYGSAFGWNLGFVSYDPFVYGTTRWVWGRYGLWYNPYDPWLYGGYYGGYGGYGYGGYDTGGSYESTEQTGSIRLRVSPKTAQVFIDGKLMGIVDDFDGLGGHLVLASGSHEIELRAPGYETYTGTITVSANETRTERLSLTKK